MEKIAASVPGSRGSSAEADQEAAQAAKAGMRRWDSKRTADHNDEQSVRLDLALTEFQHIDGVQDVAEINTQGHAHKEQQLWNDTQYGVSMPGKKDNLGRLGIGHIQ